MAQDYSIWIVSPPGYAHSRCFAEVALALREAFAALGHDAPIVTDPADARGQTIALGANLIPRIAMDAPPSCILFNLEQIGDDCSWLTPAYIELLRQHRVWDYSSKNIEALAKLGVGATLCEIGYTAALTRIAPVAQDIDIAFVGSLSDRRQDLLKELHNLGKNVFAAFNVYGAERDTIYARARIAINIHCFESSVFEIVRCSYLLANKICVVSESGSDAGVEEEFRGGIAFAGYDRLVETCVDLLEDDDARLDLANAGFAIFSRRSQARYLRAALAATNVV